VNTKVFVTYKKVHKNWSHQNFNHW